MSCSGVAMTFDRALLLLVVVVVLAMLLGQLVTWLRRPLFELLRNGDMQKRALALLESAVIGIYDGDTPVCAAVFISDTLALTAEHDASPTIGTVLRARSAPDSKPVRLWEFKVIAVSQSDDVAVLQRISGPAPAQFLAVHDAAPIQLMKGKQLVLATFGIAAAARAGDAAGSVLLGAAISRPAVFTVGHRHFAYPAETGRGDSGAAVLSLDGKLVGLHLGGWNHADSPPPSPKDKAGTKPAAAAEARKNKERLAAMGLDHVGSATRNSVVNLARTLTVGGYAIFLTKDRVRALCRGGRMDGAIINAAEARSAAEAVASAAAAKSAPTVKLRGRPKRAASRG